VRGSSSYGGKKALGEMIERVRQAGLGAHVVDGPKGPAGRVKLGLIKLAQETNAAIVPFYVTTDRCWYVNSWDRFMIPKPGARVSLRFSDPIHLDPASDREALERQRQDVEAQMRRDGWNEEVDASRQG
jgi:lysophospholipid acyltransferase (LPLAT)-like uncharacterized protein